MDRNFDDLAHRFKRNIYDSLKGEIRLAVLKRDLAKMIPELAPIGSENTNRSPQWLHVLDAGGGQGQLSVELSTFGHHIDLCDISGNMLDIAREKAEKSGAGNIQFIHGSIQDVAGERIGQYDLILCHAVLEWVVEPRKLLDKLVDALKPGGHLSLMFYNLNSLKMKNLLRANFRKVIEDDYRAYRGSLTPTYPRETSEVMEWLDREKLQLLCHSGVRCFHDYILDPDLRTVNPDQQVELELRFSIEEPFRSLGRYIHLIYQKNGHTGK